MSKPTHQPFATTFDYPIHSDFLTRNEIAPGEDIESIRGKLGLLRKILLVAKEKRGLILDSSVHIDIVACAVIGFWRKSRRPVIVMAGDMWHKDRGLAGVIQTIGLQLADRAISLYAPLSTEEFPHFEKAWGISKDKLRFLPYFYTFTREDLSAPAPLQGDFIFSGGNAHRDYLPLVQAMESLPEYRLVIGSRRLDGVKLPPNVTAKQLSRPEFIQMMRASKAVIVPIAKDLARSTGHQTYLNGMMLGKPTIINDVLGVKEYTQNGEHAIIVDGTPQGYIEAIRRVMDPANHPQVEAMCKSARESVRNTFTFEKHCERMIQILYEALQTHRE